MNEAAKNAVLETIIKFGDTEGPRHKQWLLDQVVRILTNCPTVEKRAIFGPKYLVLGESEEYLAWVSLAEDEARETWDIGVAP